MASLSLVRGTLPVAMVIGLFAGNMLAQQARVPGQMPDPSKEPPVVTPGTTQGAPPSDAIVLFDGTDLSRWASDKGNGPAPWKVADGVLTVAPDSGGIHTKEGFGSSQLHIEWATPAEVKGDGQGRGNSGVFFMRTYEVQILDSFQNKTYFHGQASAIYKQHAPLVNASRKPGEWQTYDIVFEAPKFNGTTLVAPAYITVFWNGVLVQHRRPVMGSTSATTTQHAYTPHDPELPLTLQDHSHPVRYRNVWIRRLTGYDLPEK
jgi:3-keto-disaccharide hydrolase